MRNKRAIVTVEPGIGQRHSYRCDMSLGQGPCNLSCPYTARCSKVVKRGVPAKTLYAKFNTIDEARAWRNQIKRASSIKSNLGHNQTRTRIMRELAEDVRTSLRLRDLCSEFFRGITTKDADFERHNPITQDIVRELEKSP